MAHCKEGTFTPFSYLRLLWFSTDWPVKVFRHANVITKPVRRKRQDFFGPLPRTQSIAERNRRSKKENPGIRKWSPLFEIPIN